MTPIFYESEKKRLEETERIVRWQLTDHPSAGSYHFYFTENSFTKGKDTLYFFSERDTPGAMNVFCMDVSTGAMRRITDVRAPHRLTACTKSPDGEKLLYWLDDELTVMDVATRAQRALFRAPKGFAPGRVSLNCTGEWVGAQLNEEVGLQNGINYAGFEERMYRIKRCLYYLIPAAGGQARLILRDTAEGGHLQFSPVNPSLMMFCHEGPWHLVQQRIFLMDARTGEHWPCFRQSARDSVGHEFFTRDGEIFFDNRGPGHDGTITSDRTQACAAQPAPEGFVPYVGRADERGEVTAVYPMPFYCNHYHSNTDMSLLVGDDVDDLELIDLRQSPPKLEKLCTHHTSWHGQQTHCHPTFSWDDKRILYTSDATGHTELYLIELK